MVKSKLRWPKGETRKAAKGRRKRRERAVVQAVRPEVAARDGHCRFAGAPLGACAGPSEWAHFGDKKRARTRGMDPDERHTTAGSFMGCRAHHGAYDSGELRIDALTERGCDGPLRAERDGVVWIEERA